MAEWPDEQYASVAFDVGLACLELLTNEDRWIHRRVETIDILQRELARRQVTVEFTLPSDLDDDLRIGSAGPWCVPIAVMNKKPLRRFDLREAGQPVPILERELNGLVASELLTAAAILALDYESIGSDIQAALTKVATGAPSQALDGVAELLQMSDPDVEPDPAGTIVNDETVGYFLSTLAGNYILIALLEKPGGRRILKYSYDDQLDFVFGNEGRLSFASLSEPRMEPNSGGRTRPGGPPRTLVPRRGGGPGGAPSRCLHLRRTERKRSVD